MVKLQCDERFVYQPPTLTSMCCAKIVNSKSLKTDEDIYIFKVIGNDVLQILTRDYLKSDVGYLGEGYLWHYYGANKIPEIVLRNIEYTWGYSPCDIVDKSQVNNAIYLEALAEKNMTRKNIPLIRDFNNRQISNRKRPFRP